MRTWPSSLRARLTLWYSALLALPLITFAIVCYFVFAAALLERTDHFIGDALTAFSRELAAERRATERVDDALRTTVSEVRFRDLHIVILNATHQVVASTAVTERDASVTPDSGLMLDREILVALGAYDISAPLAATINTDGERYRMMSRPLELQGTVFGLIGTYSLRDTDDMLRRIRAIFAFAIPILIVVAATSGHMLATRSLAPMSTMTAHAKAISAANLHQRLPVAGGDELVTLATVVNELLDRLEASFEQQRQFMTDASHELRTPAAILRTEADVTLSQSHRTEEEYRETVAHMQDVARRLTRIVDDLFLLARADAGHLVAQRKAIYLEEVVHDAARAVRHMAEQRNVRVELGQVVEAPFEGDPDLLGRLLLNLLDNAIKYSPEGARVDINMTQQDGKYVIAVIDNGDGIPAADRERVFNRFYRVDSARSRSESSATSGSGLGLAIARRIAEVHGGTLTLVESRPGRTEFRAVL